MAASFPDHSYSDHTNFSTEFFSFPFPIQSTWADNYLMGEESSNMSSCNSATINYTKLPLMNCDVNSPVSVASFPETFGFSECMTVPEPPEFDAGFRDFSSCNYKHQNLVEQADELMFWPAYQMAAPRGMQRKGSEARFEETEVKTGRYSVEERKGRILRYLQKRNQRNFNKTIKYACRKTLADKRVRVRGRFAKNNDPCDNENGPKNTSDHYCYYSSFDEQLIPMKYEEDDWLEVATASLSYLPSYLPG